MSFINLYKISIVKPPTEKYLYDFLEAKMNTGLQSNTIRTYFSHLNLACQELYKVRLEKFLSLSQLINNSSTGDTFSDDEDWMEAAADLGAPTSKKHPKLLLLRY